MGIKEIKIPEGIETIEMFTFQFCGNIEKISLPSTLKSIKYKAFLYNSLPEIKLPRSIEEVNSSALDVPVVHSKKGIVIHVPKEKRECLGRRYEQNEIIEY